VARLGWTIEDTDATLEYLEHEGLVSFQGLGPEIGITHRGVVEVEHAIERPAEPTEHLAPHTVVIVHGDMQGSAIQAGTVASHQSQTVALGDQREAIEAFTQLLRQALDAVELSNDERRVTQAELLTVEAQLALREPKRGRPARIAPIASCGRREHRRQWDVRGASRTSSQDPHLIANGRSPRVRLGRVLI
jgi:hypothetical protein